MLYFTKIIELSTHTVAEFEDGRMGFEDEGPIRFNYTSLKLRIKECKKYGYNTNEEEKALKLLEEYE